GPAGRRRRGPYRRRSVARPDPSRGARVPPRGRSGRRTPPSRPILARPRCARHARAATVATAGAVLLAPAPSSPVVTARQTRSGVMGRRRTRLPVAAAIALATAAAVGTIGGSPTPFEPRGPPFD